MSIVGFSDIGADRDLSSNTFTNSLEKTLEKAYTEAFFNQYYKRPSEPKLARMTGVHTIGAIIGRGVHQTLTLLTQDPSQPRSTVDPSITLKKYRLLLTWIDAFAGEMAKLTYQASSQDVLACLKTSLMAVKAKGLQVQSPLLQPAPLAALEAEVDELLKNAFPVLIFD
jgi:hypothetical protein